MLNDQLPVPTRAFLRARLECNFQRSQQHLAGTVDLATGIPPPPDTVALQSAVVKGGPPHEPYRGRQDLLNKGPRGFFRRFSQGPWVCEWRLSEAEVGHVSIGTRGALYKVRSPMHPGGD